MFIAIWDFARLIDATVDNWNLDELDSLLPPDFRGIVHFGPEDWHLDD